MSEKEYFVPLQKGDYRIKDVKVFKEEVRKFDPKRLESLVENLETNISRNSVALDLAKLAHDSRIGDMSVENIKRKTAAYQRTLNIVKEEIEDYDLL